MMAHKISERDEAESSSPSLCSDRLSPFCSRCSEAKGLTIDSVALLSLSVSSSFSFRLSLHSNTHVLSLPCPRCRKEETEETEEKPG